MLCTNQRLKIVVVIMKTYEWSNDATNDEGNDVRPSRQGDVVLQHDNEAKSEAADKNDHVPPPRSLLVVLDHVRVVTVVELSLACALVRSDDVLAHQEDDVGDKSTDLGVDVRVCDEKNEIGLYLPRRLP